VFEKSHQGEESFKAKLDAKEYALFKHIFFMKKEILTEIHNQKFKT
jgi:hypothetical protein